MICNKLIQWDKINYICIDIINFLYSVHVVKTLIITIVEVKLVFHTWKIILPNLKGEICKHIASRIVEIECVVRGYHVYKEDWKPDIGRFETEVEDFNRHDRYAGAV